MAPIIVIGSLGLAKMITRSVQKPYDKFRKELK
ncbi:uncharacterized protein METZ01_LOCUS107818 [marine metagenome]|uniref:Uncharacterized protein n=1 Tax=marine metagenome TaxID=408172 RepID=A0A381WR39_9ZZZZ